MSDTSAKQNRTIVIVGVIVGALLVAVLVVGIIIVNTMNAQADDAAYRACMATMGVGPEGTVTDVDEMEPLALWSVRPGEGETADSE